MYTQKAPRIISLIASITVLISILGCDTSTNSSSTSTDQSPPLDDMHLDFRGAFDLDATHLDRNFEGHDIAKIASTLEEHSRELKPSKKSEFETAAQYNQKVLNFNPMKSIYGISSPDKHYLAFIVPRYKSDLEYDAEEQSFKVAIPDLFSVVGITFENKSLGEREYDASNAYGAKVKVKEENEVWYKIEINKQGGLAFRGLGEGDRGFSRTIPMPVEKAKKIKSFLHFIVIGTPVAPWYDRFDDTIDATFKDPTATNSSTHTIHLNIEEIWLVDTLTGEIVKKWHKADELKSLLKETPLIVEIKTKGTAIMEIYVDDDVTGKLLISKSLPKTKLFLAKKQVKIHSLRPKEETSRSKDESSIYVNGKPIKMDWKRVKIGFDIVVTAPSPTTAEKEKL